MKGRAPASTNRKEYPMSDNLIHSAFTVERIYPASIDRVFACFADTEKLRRWLVEGEGWTIDAFSNNFEVLGFQRSLFRWQGGPQISNDGIYHEIVEKERIITSYSMAMEGKIFSVSLLTTEFKEQDGGTLLTLTEQGTYMGDENSAANREEGFRGLLDKLGEEIATNG
jgi:uncharacterized protein YndB with AHSA1/START domain